ncbi:hypothetical protein [Tenacibaculum sp. M341]|uniref:hypothetical protein n=1 Tax=Tenacibaculum sp. M341 TaxID=2530339 RepID=UPI0010444E1B|nr:hypothetical protein [Tenacibaculum sp. M341]TCI95092.1 hypothetical protein EYW44_01850 [Tenacibaculum sp. M341]
MKDTLIIYASGIGVPKLVFKIALIINENNGGAAITNALHRASMRRGMENGIGVFVFIGIVTFQITSFCVHQYYKNKIEQEILFLKLGNTDAILAQIDTYFISKNLKQKLKSTYLLPNY